MMLRTLLDITQALQEEGIRYNDYRNLQFMEEEKAWLKRWKDLKKIPIKS